MEAKHSPGPWRVGPRTYGDTTRHDTIYAADGKPIGGTGGYIGDRAETEANAALIAAAPDLLAACEGAARVLTPTDPSKFSAEDERRRIGAAQVLLAAALARARGES